GGGQIRLVLDDEDQPEHAEAVPRRTLHHRDAGVDGAWSLEPRTRLSGIARRARGPSRLLSCAMSRPPVLALVVSLVLTGAAAGRVSAGPGEARPETGHLVLAGVGMARAVYVLGITADEGSHALAALALGLDIESIRLYPGRHDGRWYLGWVDVHGIA